MAVWGFAIVLSVAVGVVAGLMENWARFDVIPNSRILAVGLIVAVGSAVPSMLIFGALIVWFPVILAPAVLLLDRTAADARRSL